MHNKLLKKGMILGIILLFVGVSVNLSAFQINSNINNGIEGNCEIEQLDEYTEIISLITGSGRKNSQWEPFEVNLTNGNLLIISYTTSGFKIKHISQIDINFFVGLHTTPHSFGWTWIFGLAIGNIIWE